MTLTGRSVSLIAAAAVSLAVAVLVGIPALMPVVCLCAGMVVVALLASFVAAPRIEATRTIEPAIVEPDESVEVRLEVTVRSVVPVVATRWRDRVPSSLLGTPSGDVPPMTEPRTTLRYELRAHRRGSHQIGPLSVTVGDAFGLVERTLTTSHRDRFIVLPRRHPLDAQLGPGGSSDGTSRLHATSGLGQDDVIARPYLPGDALKRWHWKATAHRGEPMVRQEESELRPTVLVVLDADPRVHDHDGFEWSVSAAASLVTHYGERRFDVDLACGDTVMSLDAGHGLEEALVALTLVEPSSAPVVLPARERTTIVLTGVLTQDAAARLLQTVPSRDTIAYVGRGSRSEALDLLDRSGWHVVVRDPLDDLAHVWAQTAGVTAP